MDLCALIVPPTQLMAKSAVSSLSVRIGSSVTTDCLFGAFGTGISQGVTRGTGVNGAGPSVSSLGFRVTTINLSMAWKLAVQAPRGGCGDLKVQEGERNRKYCLSHSAW
jgi:hypothetical protein